MSTTFFSGKLTPSPTAAECREALKNISYRNEKRQGNMMYVLIYGTILFLLMLSAVFILGSVLRNAESLVFICSLVVSFTILSGAIFSVSYEQKLTNKNQVKKVKEFMAEYLDSGERILCVFVGRAVKPVTPAWLGDIGPYAFFIFTTDRLLIITFKQHLIGTDLINKEIAKGTIRKDIVNIHTCSINDDRSFRVSKLFFNHVLLNLVHTKVAVCPVGENEPYSWLLDNKHTQHGMVFREIVSNLMLDKHYG